jgi:hypothetical protein
MLFFSAPKRGSLTLRRKWRPVHYEIGVLLLRAKKGFFEGAGGETSANMRDGLRSTTALLAKRAVENRQERAAARVLSVRKRYERYVLFPVFAMVLHKNVYGKADPLDEDVLIVIAASLQPAPDTPSGSGLVVIDLCDD